MLFYKDDFIKKFHCETFLWQLFHLVLKKRAAAEAEAVEMSTFRSRSAAGAARCTVVVTLDED
jgi:hypothetical protein